MHTGEAFRETKPKESGKPSVAGIDVKVPVGERSDVIMSSDEDICTVSENGLECQRTMEHIRQEIERYKAKHKQVVEDQKEMSKAIEEERHLAEEFRQRAISRSKMQLEEEQEYGKDLELLQGKIFALQQEESTLKEKEMNAMQALHHLEALTATLKEQTQVPNAVPERNVVFTGALGNGEGSCPFGNKPRVLYPMEGGTALLTFEDDEVAEKIVSLKHHEVSLDSCFIRLQAEPVLILEPSRIEMGVHICPKQILVSNLPKNLEQNRIVDKLEIHFSKSWHGGGEVEGVEFLHDSGNVVVTFVQDTVSKGLTDKQFHDVDFGSGRKLKVHVNPFKNGEITGLKTCMSKSRRTVLLTGIPTIMEPEDLQDHLEIHFQKTSNGGGEIDAIAYNPLGQHKMAIFEEDCPSMSS